MKRALLTALLSLMLIVVATAALAHDDSPHTGYWEWDVFIVAPLVLSAALYARGAYLLWHRAGPGRGIPHWQAFAFAAGWLTLAGALISPLHWLGEHLFTAHMIEHELLMAVAAPLIALSRPLTAFMHALPKPWRSRLTQAAHARVVRSAWDGIMDPTVATIIHGVALWLWHVPALFDSTVSNELMHRLQHISFLLSALIFWWALFRPRVSEYGIGAAHVFATMLHMSLLGVLLTLAPRVLYTAQTAGAAEFGLSPLEDQQLAGLVMWIPAGTIYGAIALFMLALWLKESALTGPRGFPSRR